VAAEPFLSVVVPFFNEEDNIDALFGRLLPSLRAIGRPFEVVCVDDGSKDRTLEMLLATRAASPEVVVKSFARNFGQHAAVTAGLAAARGAFVVTLDADLQNPPEEVARLVAEFEQGHDYVGTIRMNRDDSAFRKLASKMVGGATRKMSGLPIRDFGCMLRGYSRDIAHAIAERHETRTFIPALGYLFSKNPVEIEVKHEARHEGRSKYSLLNLIRLNFDLMSGFSVAPLRLLFTFGLFAAATGFALFVYIVIERIMLGSAWAAEGVFTLFGILFLFVGAQFVAFGLIGEYVGRILQTVRQRPPYVLRELDKESRA
jgi:undecaprenyl-phosphate 4-deoxy-4-formamido-L-arabinose transferase